MKRVLFYAGFLVAAITIFLPKIFLERTAKEHSLTVVLMAAFFSFAAFVFITFGHFDKFRDKKDPKSISMEVFITGLVTAIASFFIFLVVLFARTYTF